MSTTILNGHTSPETAHLSFCYPFGATVKCVRREWIERAEKGQSRGLYRFVSQTTSPAFNNQYTSLIRSEGQEAADAWATTTVKSAGWNKPKADTYNALVVLAQSPLPDGTGRLGTSPLHLNAYASAQQIEAFRTQAGDQLDEAAAERLERMAQAANRSAQRTST